MVKINIIKSKKVIITQVSMMLTQREIETMIGKVGQVFFFFFWPGTCYEDVSFTITLNFVYVLYTLLIILYISQRKKKRKGGPETLQREQPLISSSG